MALLQVTWKKAFFIRQRPVFLKAECQQMKGSLGTLEHTRNAKGPKLAVLLGDVDPL